MSRYRIARLLVSACALSCLIAAVFAAAVPAKDQDDAQLRDRMRMVMSAWQTMDPANAAPFYSRGPDAVYFDMAPLKYVGWDAYASGTKSMFQDFRSLTLTLNEDAWIERQGNLAITAATGRGEVVHKDGHTQSMDWRWTVVWEKQGDNWLITHEHLSSPLAMETGAQGSHPGEKSPTDE